MEIERLTRQLVAGECVRDSRLLPSQGPRARLFRGTATLFRGLQCASGSLCASWGDEPAADITLAMAIGNIGHSDDRLHY